MEIFSSSRLINRIAYGIPEEPCNCKSNYVAQASMTTTAKDMGYADLISCFNCGYKWYSFDDGIFNWQCPRCSSTKNISAELSQKRLAQGSNWKKAYNEEQLDRVNKIFEFSDNSKPIPDLIPDWSKPRITHDSMYNNSSRVAQSSLDLGKQQQIGGNKAYKERQKMIDKLNRILGLTYSTRGLL